MPSADVYRGLRPAGAGHHAGLIGESPGVLAAQSRPWRLQAHGFPVPSKEWMSPLAVAEPPRVRSGAAVSLVSGEACVRVWARGYPVAQIGKAGGHDCYYRSQVV